jgi:hypothetical protein
MARPDRHDLCSRALPRKRKTGTGSNLGYHTQLKIMEHAVLHLLLVNLR